jgi:hypothetical protein
MFRRIVLSQATRREFSAACSTNVLERRVPLIGDCGDLGCHGCVRYIWQSLPYMRLASLFVSLFRQRHVYTAFCCLSSYWPWARSLILRAVSFASDTPCCTLDVERNQRLEGTQNSTYYVAAILCCVVGVP